MTLTPSGHSNDAAVMTKRWVSAELPTVLRPTRQTSYTREEEKKMVLEARFPASLVRRCCGGRARGRGGLFQHPRSGRVSGVGGSGVTSSSTPHVHTHTPHPISHRSKTFIKN
ncbi:hypothetical protein E2C01_067293 [Portunus trituberculatus]|uniref:Uncharacterized protein n=1 Tax=Portunus trituberculatus TaxID=210409 RepID=A0A5B7HUM5_PORTR|nr:hypothetical protein [Portunus trituberculatus]